MQCNHGVVLIDLDHTARCLRCLGEVGRVSTATLGELAELPFYCDYHYLMKLVYGHCDGQCLNPTLPLLPESAM